MSRWPVRILGILMLLVFAFLFAHLYKQLVTLQQTQRPAATQKR